MVFYKFWIADGICEKQFVRNSKELTTIDGTTYWDSPTGKRFEVWGVEKVKANGQRFYKRVWLVFQFVDVLYCQLCGSMVDIRNSDIFTKNLVTGVDMG